MMLNQPSNISSGNCAFVSCNWDFYGDRTSKSTRRENMANVKTNSKAQKKKPWFDSRTTSSNSAYWM